MLYSLLQRQYPSTFGFGRIDQKPPWAILERWPWRRNSDRFVAGGRPRKPRPLNDRAGDGGKFLRVRGTLPSFLGPLWFSVRPGLEITRNRFSSFLFPGLEIARLYDLMELEPSGSLVPVAPRPSWAGASAGDDEVEAMGTKILRRRKRDQETIACLGENHVKWTAHVEEYLKTTTPQSSRDRASVGSEGLSTGQEDAEASTLKEYATVLSFELS
ncbi:hypothetical protein B296_00008468 [Ensete ventricosum]|uniref:Uncharacterized protein n=1 Tax=Ensete ventricosum TaxID=4639 RepID=A0A427AR93_ENSVE|nr:hypothetical protein B296_00008468 [Ensete ventricosum]